MEFQFARAPRRSAREAGAMFDAELERTVRLLLLNCALLRRDDAAVSWAIVRDLFATGQSAGSRWVQPTPCLHWAHCLLQPSLEPQAAEATARRGDSSRPRCCMNSSGDITSIDGVETTMSKPDSSTSKRRISCSVPLPTGPMARQVLPRLGQACLTVKGGHRVGRDRPSNLTAP